MTNEEQTDLLSNTPIFVYEFLYNSSCCESAAATISIHRSNSGAEMAMESHKAEIQKEYEEMREGDDGENPEFFDKFKWDFDKWWGIRKCELLP